MTDDEFNEMSIWTPERHKKFETFIKRFGLIAVEEDSEWMITLTAEMIAASKEIERLNKANNELRQTVCGLEEVEEVQGEELEYCYANHPQ